MNTLQEIEDFFQFEISQARLAISQVTDQEPLIRTLLAKFHDKVVDLLPSVCQVNYKVPV